MELSVVILLIATGMCVGVINTFAGGAAALTIAVFTMLGLPVNIANGTNRVPVLFQCLTTSITFASQRMLDYRTGLRLSIPTVIGAIIGAQFAAIVSNSLMTTLLVTVLIIMLVMLAFNPTKIMLSNSLNTHRKIIWSDYLWFLLIGLYGGCFHIGVGYLILAIVLMGMGYNLIEANALKAFIVLMYIPFSLTIFILNGQVEIMYGVVHGIGNVIGAFIAARYAKHIGMKFLRWFLIIFTAITILDLLKIIDIKNIIFLIFNHS